jgi:hypothetical protein
MHRGLATALVALALALAVAGCHRERTFNDRYDETARNIQQRAATLDNELNQGDVEPSSNNTRHRSAEGRKARW